MEKQEEKKTDKEKEVSQSVIKKNTNKKTKYVSGSTIKRYADKRICICSSYTCAYLFSQLWNSRQPDIFDKFLILIYSGF